MRKSTILTVHLAYWLIYALLLFASILTLNGYEIGPGAFRGVFLYLFLGLLNFYLFYFFLVPRFLASRKVKLFFASAVGFSMFNFPIMMLSPWAAGGPKPTSIEASVDSIVSVAVQWFLVFFVCTMVGLINGMLGALMRGFTTWYNEIQVKEGLVKRNVQTELALLKAQLNPHFLFNTLNNIDVLIETEPSVASEYLKKLSDIMRFMLYDTQDTLIPLGQELEYIRKYLDLQNIRTSNEKFVAFEVVGNTDNLNIPPMLFIPFIENAFKHSSNKKIRNAITIFIEVMDGGKILFSCKNMVPLETSVSTPKSGLGIELIKHRLQLLYPGRHALDIVQKMEFFNVSLLVQTHAD